MTADTANTPSTYLLVGTLPRQGRPFDHPGLMRRIAPFALVALVSPLLVLLPPGPGKPIFLGLAYGLLLALAAVISWVPWDRLAGWAHLSVPFCYFGVIALMRQSAGPTETWIWTLSLIPVFWVALFGSVPQMLVTIAVGSLVMILPPLAYPSERYTPEQLTRGLVWLVLTTVIGTVTSGLVAMNRNRADYEAGQAALNRLRATVAQVLAEPHTELIWTLNRVVAEFGVALGASAVAATLSIGAADIEATWRSHNLVAETDPVLLQVELTSQGVPVGQLVIHGTAKGMERWALQPGVFDSLGGHIGDYVTRIYAEAASERLQAEFLSLVSHEMRTPLTAITGYAGLLKSGIETGAPTEQLQSDVDTISTNAARMRRLVSDLLASTESGRVELPTQKRECDLAEVLYNCVRSAQPYADTRHIELHGPASKSPQMIVIDTDRVAQAIDNLISNAIKFSGVGGSVQTELQHSPEGLSVSVSDTGPGIPADEQPLVFGRFFRGRTATQDQTPGLGIGLAVVCAVATSHGGTVKVRSDKTSGTTFTIFLPFHPPTSVPDRPDTGGRA